MTRPSKDAVYSALAVCDRDQLSASSYPVILADEVRALRADLAEARRNAELHNDAANAAELRIVELRATIARVEAVSERWLDDGGPPWTAADYDRAIENALKDEP